MPFESACLCMMCGGARFQHRCCNVATKNVLWQLPEPLPQVVAFARHAATFLVAGAVGDWPNAYSDKRRKVVLVAIRCSGLWVQTGSLRESQLTCIVPGSVLQAEPNMPKFTTALVRLWD